MRQVLIMLKELGIIFAVIGCISLWLPLASLYPTKLAFITIITLGLLGLVLLYAALYIEKLVSSNQKRRAGAFVLILLIVIIAAVIAVPQIELYFLIRRRFIACLLLGYLLCRF
jgi:hypothetical protein